MAAHDAGPDRGAGAGEVHHNGASPHVRANTDAYERLTGADPVLVGIERAGDVLPGMTPETILTSGPPTEWDALGEGQRRAVRAALRLEGLAADDDEAEQRIAAGDVTVEPCHHHGAVGSMAGIYTASMPVLVVQDRASGRYGYCTLYEGPSPRRLTYGFYDEQVEANLRWLTGTIAPSLAHAIDHRGGVELEPIIRRALRMGDELHSRNAAATLLLLRELAPGLLHDDRAHEGRGEAALAFLSASDLFFLHPGMAAAKAAADAASGIPGARVVTAMTISSVEFGIRVSGTGDSWFTAPVPPVEGTYFPGYSADDQAFIGGESMIVETVGLGGFSAAAAFALRQYAGGSAERMVEHTEEMYRITVGEHPGRTIPYLDRGAPVGIDVDAVVRSGVTPVIHMGLAHRDGGQIGAGVMRAPLEVFQQAHQALHQQEPAGSG